MLPSFLGEFDCGMVMINVFVEMLYITTSDNIPSTYLSEKRYKTNNPITGEKAEGNKESAGKVER